MEIDELQLHESQRGAEAWRFLMTIASAVATVGGVAFIAFLRTIDFQFNAWTTFVALSGAYAWLSAIGLTLALTYHRAVILAASMQALSLAILIATPLRSLVLTIYIPQRSPMLVFVATVVLYVPTLVLLNGTRLSRSPVLAQERAGVRPSLSIILSNMLGVHPICWWLPSRTRQVIVFVLFVLSRLLLGWGITILCVELWSYYFFRSKQAAVIAACDPGVWTASCIGEASAFLFIPILFVVLTFLLAAATRFGARRLARSSLEQLVSKDHRSPVLFLRSFSDDMVRLRPPKRSPFVWAILKGDPRPFLDHIILESLIPLGPVVAIGNPQKRPPFGIARTYVSNAQWQAVVTDLAERARLIIIAADETPGVRWEIGLVSTPRLVNKTLFILPPRFTSHEQAERLFVSAFANIGAKTADLGVVRRFFEQRRCPCIGWYVDADKSIKVFTASELSDVAYALAIRSFAHLHT
jgi:hypothetical protein